MTDREAMQQALEALEDACGGRCNAEYNPCWQRNVADSLRERLAQPEQEPLQFKCTVIDDAHPNGVPLEQWGKQPEQEPVTLPCCGYADASAVKWNPYSKAVQCHNCGQTYTPLAQPEQEPVAWLLTDKNINSLQVESIQRLIDRTRHAHTTDIKLRINGQDEWHEADWLKHMVRVTTPQRKLYKREWIDLTDEVIWLEYQRFWPFHPAEEPTLAKDIVKFARAIEAKLKEKNT